MASKSFLLKSAEMCDVMKFKNKARKPWKKKPTFK